MQYSLLICNCKIWHIQTSNLRKTKPSYVPCEHTQQCFVPFDINIIQGKRIVFYSVLCNGTIYEAHIHDHMKHVCHWTIRQDIIIITSIDITMTSSTRDFIDPFFLVKLNWCKKHSSSVQSYKMDYLFYVSGQTWLWLPHSKPRIVIHMDLVSSGIMNVWILVFSIEKWKGLLLATSLSEMISLHHRRDETFGRLFLSHMMAIIAATPVLEPLKAPHGRLDLDTPYLSFSYLLY